MHMKRMIQIRNVPEHIHRAMKVRAAKAGLSLSDYLLSELRRLAEQPTLGELWERISARERVDVGEPAAAAIRAERDAREAEVGGARSPGRGSGTGRRGSRTA
jgi:plasmid stability protein